MSPRQPPTTTCRPVSCTSNGIQSRSHDFGRGGGCGHEACRTMQSATPPPSKNMERSMLQLGYTEVHHRRVAPPEQLNRARSTTTPGSPPFEPISIRPPSPRSDQNRARRTFSPGMRSPKTFLSLHADSWIIRISTGQGLRSIALATHPHRTQEGRISQAYGSRKATVREAPDPKAATDSVRLRFRDVYGPVTRSSPVRAKGSIATWLNPHSGVAKATPEAGDQAEAEHSLALDQSASSRAKVWTRFVIAAKARPRNGARARRRAPQLITLPTLDLLPRGIERRPRRLGGTGSGRSFAASPEPIPRYASSSRSHARSPSCSATPGAPPPSGGSARRLT